MRRVEEPVVFEVPEVSIKVAEIGLDESGLVVVVTLPSVVMTWPSRVRLPLSGRRGNDKLERSYLSETRRRTTGDGRRASPCCALRQHVESKVEGQSSYRGRPASSLSLSEVDSRATSFLADAWPNRDKDSGFERMTGDVCDPFSSKMLETTPRGIDFGQPSAEPVLNVRVRPFVKATSEPMSVLSRPFAKATLKINFECRNTYPGFKWTSVESSSGDRAGVGLEWSDVESASGDR